MNRRDFIKSIGLVGAAATTGVGIAVLSQPKAIEFDSATLKRNYNDTWLLTFTTSKLFSPAKEDGIIVEIGEQKFKLLNWDSLEHSTDKDTVTHRLSGKGWESV